MKFLIEKGLVNAVSRENWKTDDGREGVNLYVLVKEKVGDGEFGAVIIHKLKGDLVNEKFYEGFKGQVVSITGQIYTRQTKEKKATFSDFVLDTIELVN